METNTLPVDSSRLGHIKLNQRPNALIDEWSIDFEEGTDLKSLQRAAQELRDTNTPVAFPTETVYGLGADATRSDAVRAIFAAKGRPADNPLIVHVWSIQQLQELLLGRNTTDRHPNSIPKIYEPLIRRFWPGPLTIILPNPESSFLAPEVTAGLSTFGARMPRSILALALIRLAGVPLAAPSANASTRPSPTAAEHVKDDLDGRIHTIIDGGPCEVGVESTVVDGLSSPPTILRPGGITVEQLRQCPGWENVVVGYKDEQEGVSRPRAPGMKYRHYSPKAKVVLYEGGAKAPKMGDLLTYGAEGKTFGVIRTMAWPAALGFPAEIIENGESECTNGTSSPADHSPPETQSHFSNLFRNVLQHSVPHAKQHRLSVFESKPIDIWDINLGSSSEDVARGLFSALRELDQKGTDVIYVEGIDDQVGDDIAAAVMNRLRKAAEIKM
ncbi:translation factor [Polyplosphaeria fusca]|uniref:Threonylcarbamoyl-AMP synthase n=1 Tax=Polyplosphaeria fusca TaxID=682080 RepID=A0A9P4V7D7_9PLEO|nr:translation factor [Polyplosphaeria fusca]